MAKQEKEKKNQKSFWKNFKAELKKVIWPTKKQLANSTMVVIAMVLVTTLIVLVLDLAFEALNTYGINKIKQAVQDSISTSVDDEEETTDDATEDGTEGETDDVTIEDTESDTEESSESGTTEDTKGTAEDNNETTE